MNLESEPSEAPAPKVDGVNGERSENGNPWFAIRVRSRHEKTVHTALCGKGYAPFLPLYPRIRHGKPLRSEGLPIFPGYVFCSFNPLYRMPILTIPGVVLVLCNGRELTAVPREEIESLRIMTQSGFPIVQVPFVRVGDPIRITRGPLYGLTGVVAALEGVRQVVVSVQLFQRSVAVRLQDDWITREGSQASLSSHPIALSAREPLVRIGA
ncbi:MAG TPA: transcription termination/antitermination NusG family protein [Candidatus Angelobacter sp.]|nr:transcription termination/antitermination NusG family protein [Candidatus Angelobacter sp.]